MCYFLLVGFWYQKMKSYLWCIIHWHWVCKTLVGQSYRIWWPFTRPWRPQARMHTHSPQGGLFMWGSWVTQKVGVVTSPWIRGRVVRWVVRQPWAWIWTQVAHKPGQVPGYTALKNKQKRVASIRIILNIPSDLNTILWGWIPLQKQTCFLWEYCDLWRLCSELMVDLDCTRLNFFNWQFGLNIGLGSPFVVTKFPQKWRPKGIENLSNLEYVPTRLNISQCQSNNLTALSQIILCARLLSSFSNSLRILDWAVLGCSAHSAPK